MLNAPPIVAIGGSAGALEPLIRVVSDLPANLRAAVLVVIHMPPQARTSLDVILARAGHLPTAFACDGEPVPAGGIRIAPPDRHLLVHQDRLRVVDGPRTNNHRPAIDPLFRSASRWRGRDLVGVILSGALDDGAVGLLAVAARGGVTVVQAPEEALFPDMPTNALSVVRADHVLPATGIGPAIVRAVGNRQRIVAARDRTRMTVATADPSDRPAMAPASEALPAPGSLDVPDGAEDDELARPSTYSCPACGGVLWETHDEPPSYRCRVGHAYSPGTLDATQHEVVEEALWSVLRTLEERASLNERLARRARDVGDAGGAERFEERQRDAHRRAEQIRKVLTGVSGHQPDPRRTLARGAPNRSTV